MRTPSLLLGLLVGVGLLAGCSSSASRGLSQDELVVVFAPDVTATQVAQARTACDGVAGAKAEPRGANNAINRANPLRFDITGLSMTAQAKLSECLSKQPGVRGYTTDDGTN